MDLICRLKESRWFSLFFATIIINFIAFIILIIIPEATYFTSVFTTIGFVVSIFMLFSYRNTECKQQTFIEQTKTYKKMSDSLQ